MGAKIALVEGLERRMLLAGDGLSGIYYNNIDFTGSTVSRIDPQVNFGWGSGSPSPLIGPDTFSARWTGQVLAPTSGTYTFYVRTDDGVRLWVNGKLLVDYWHNQGATERSGQITLQAGLRYDIRMDYYENTGDAVARLRWSAPGMAKVAIPQAYLYSTTIPVPAANLQASPGGSVLLTWVDNATNEQNWIVERSTDGVNFSQLAVLPANTTTYHDTSAQELVSYVYRVTSINVAGTSAPSTVSITTPLEAPTNLTATAGANTPWVSLQWTDNSLKEANYVVARSTDGGVTFTPIAQLPADTTTFKDVGSLATGATYQYQVTATTTGASSAPASTAASTAGFHVLDATLYSSKPDLTPLGMENIYVAYQGSFFSSFPTDPTLQATASPSEAATRAVADKAVAAGSKVLVIDIECWPMDLRSATDAQVQAGIDKFTQVIGWLRSEAPTLKIGIYSVLPLGPSNAAINGDTTAIAAWQAADDRLATLAAQVDYLFPSLYTLDVDPTVWYRRATMTVAEARRYGKPVYPFTLMNYHDMLPVIGNTPLPSDYWRMELETLRQTADGVVIWGGYKQSWDPSAPWWLVTQSLLTDPSNTSPLAAPGSLSATSSPGRVDLAWTDNSTNEAGFVIERSLDGSTFAPVAVVGPNVTAYTDTTVMGRTYYYRVIATDWVNESSPSGVVSVAALRAGMGTTIQAESYDGASASGIVTAASYIGGFDGAWVKYGNMSFSSQPGVFVAAVAVPSAYANQQIEIRLDSPTGTLAGSLSPAATGSWYTFVPQSTSVTNISGIHDVYLVFRGRSGIANVDWLRFDTGVAPSAPSNLTAAWTSTSQVQLSWSDTSGGQAGFKIERSRDGTNYSQIGVVGAGVTTYADQPGSSGLAYYRVRANTLSGGDSSPTSVTLSGNALGVIQAEFFNASLSPVYATSTYIGVNGGNWVEYRSIDFGAGVSTFTANLAVPLSNAGQTIQLRLGSPTGTLIGSMVVNSTGSWSTFAPQTINVSGASGVQDLYLVFVGTSGIANIDWLKFS